MPVGPVLLALRASEAVKVMFHLTVPLSVTMHIKIQITLKITLIHQRANTCQADTTCVIHQIANSSIIPAKQTRLVSYIK